MPLSGSNPVRLTLFSGVQVAASTTGDGTTTTKEWDGIDRFSSAMIFLNCPTITGTSPTLNVYIETKMPDDINWCDLVSFTQVTGTASNQVAGAGNYASIAPFAITDATLAAGTTKAMHMGSTWRVKVVIGGTNPKYTFSVFALLT